MSNIRITVACPEALISDANNLAMVLAEGPADGLTYGALQWQDTGGNLYAVASFEAPPEWVQAAQGTLSRPDWDTGPPYVINMAGARRAQDALVFALEPVAAVPTLLTAIGGIPPRDALEAMGLVALPDED